jgi:hypothetical protein
MKALRILPLLLVLGAMLGLTGCETLDQRDQSLLQQHHVSAPVYNRMLHKEQLALPDITELSKRGLPEPFILNYLKSTYGVYTLNSSDVTQLARDGVSKAIIDYLLSTPTLYGPQRYPYDYPGFGLGPYPYYDYGPPPVVFVPYHASPHFR